MLINDDIECLNNIVNYSNDMIEGKKDIDEYYDDILKELLIIRGYGMNKKIKEMVENGFENEKFERIKKMFEYVKDDKEFIDFIGKNER